MEPDDDPTRCSLPHCPWRANGHDWILIQIESGPQRGEWDRMGFCSQYHATYGSYLIRGIPHKLVLESDPQDNYEDRPWLSAAMRDASRVPGWPEGMKRRQGGNSDDR